MEVVTLLIAVVALVIAILAFQRTGGGIHDLRRQMEDLSEKTEHATKGAREMTADALSRLETMIRGQQKPSSTGHEPPEDTPPTTEGPETPEDQPPTTEHKS